MPFALDTVQDYFSSQFELEQELGRLKRERRITNVFDTDETSRSVLTEYLEAAERLWDTVNTHAQQTAALENDLRLGLALYELIWSALVIPESKKTQEEIANIAGQATLRAFDLFTVFHLGSTPESQRIKQLFPTRDLAIRLARKNLRSRLREHDKQRKESTAGSKRRFSFLPRNDLNHMLVAIGLWLIITIAMALTGFSLPPPFELVFRVLPWFIALVWFPVYFLSAIPVRRFQLTILIWGTFFLLLAYGLVIGGIVAAMVYFVPLGRLMRKQTHGGHDVNLTEYVRTLSLGLVFSFFLTREMLWLVGCIIWLGFSLMLYISRSHFRKLDQVESVADLTPSRQLRHRILFFAYVITIIMFGPFVSSVWLTNQSANATLELLTVLLLAFVTLVFAVQAIVPGISSWASEDQREAQRERRIVLESVRSLRGFAIAGVIGLGLVLLLRLVPWEDITLENSVRWYVEPVFAVGFVWLRTFLGFIPGFMLNSLLYLALVFTLTVSAQVLAQVYYLFIAANAFIVPLIVKTRSTPAIIADPAEITPRHKTDEEKRLYELVARRLKNNNLLRGTVVESYVVHESEFDSSCYTITVTFWEDFPERNQLSQAAKATVDGLFSSAKNADTVRVTFFSPFPRIGKATAFSVFLHRDVWNIVIKPKHKTIPLLYKWDEVGAAFNTVILEDSFAA